jgi:hypothetical protein
MKKFSDFKFKGKKINEQQQNVLRPQNLGSSEPAVEKTEVASFISKLFEAREMAHVFHLSVNGEPGSHAIHTALGEFYESLLGFIDELTEVYQGQYDLVENYDVIDTSAAKDRQYIPYFESFAQFVKQGRKTAFSPEDTHLQNIIDEIIALNYRLLYKLKFNK